jgi:hypothetical protein
MPELYPHGGFGRVGFSEDFRTHRLLTYIDEVIEVTLPRLRALQVLDDLASI